MFWGYFLVRSGRESFLLEILGLSLFFFTLHVFYRFSSNIARLRLRNSWSLSLSVLSVYTPLGKNYPVSSWWFGGADRLSRALVPLPPWSSCLKSLFLWRLHFVGCRQLWVRSSTGPLLIPLVLSRRNQRFLLILLVNLPRLRVVFVPNSTYTDGRRRQSFRWRGGWRRRRGAAARSRGEFIWFRDLQVLVF